MNWKLLVLGGAGLAAAFVLLRNQTAITGTTTNPQLSDLGNSGTTPVGQSYSYLDGTGMQHLVATDPNGALTYYQTMPPGTSMDESGQMGSYVGMMSHYTVQPWMGYSPYYSSNNAYTTG